jgi:hypothetical protein
LLVTTLAFLWNWRGVRANKEHHGANMGYVADVIDTCSRHR